MSAGLSSVSELPEAARPRETSRDRTLPLYLAVFIVAALAPLWRLGNAPLMDIDEAMYAEIARNMVDSGDWITPHFRGETRFLKPPLYYWAAAISMKAFGENEFAVRFVSFLFGLATLGLTVLLGRWAFSLRTGFLAATLLALAPGFALMIRSSTVDMTLTLFIAVAFLGYVRMIARETPARLAPDALAFVAMWGGAALATLTKGPIGLLIPASVVGVHALATGRLRRLLGWWIAAGLALYFAIVAPWYVVCTLRHGVAFLRENLLLHNVDKFFVGGLYGAHTNYLFLLKNMLWQFAPWIVPLGFAFLFAVADLFRGPPRLRRLGDAPLLLWPWLLVPLVVFSLSQYKLPTYVDPSLPACAVLAAAMLERSFAAKGAAAWIAKATLTAGAFAALAFERLAFAKFFPIAAPALRLAPFVAFPAVISLTLYAGRRVAFAAGAVALLSFEFVMFGFLEPRINEFSPYRTAGAFLHEHAKPDDECFAIRTPIEGSLLFYSRRHFTFLAKNDDIDAAIESRKGWMLIQACDYDRISQRWKARLPVVAKWPLFHVAKLSRLFLMADSRHDELDELLLLRIRSNCD